MSEPQRPAAPPSWLGAALLTLMACQVGLLWMHGTMLERQHGELQGLRQDIQELAESLDNMDPGDDPGAGTPRPSRRRVHRRPPAIARVRWQESEGEGGVRKELSDQRKSEKDAVARARDVRDKMSIQENIRKADEKAKLESAHKSFQPFIWLGMGLVLLAMWGRSWLRNRG